jgi:2,3-bisphosphoglycerate-independent phosphoglycerate mutase
MHILMMFLDGIGLGDNDPGVNPFAVANTPNLLSLTNGHRWLRGIGRQESERAVFIPTDACLSVPGRPQSATGQATILTGLNVPQRIGEHYGPKPNPPIRAILAEDNFFKQVVAHGKKAALVEAYPPAWHYDHDRGKSLRSSYQQAAYEAGQRLFDIEDLKQKKALTPEWTGESWQTYLKLNDTPVYTPYEAGQMLVQISREYDFAMHAHWMTDMVGHRGPVERGVELLELFDGVMAGALDAWDDDEGLMIITSDHGNMEDVSHRNHTENDVPTVIIGKEKQAFAEGFHDLSDFVPRMGKMLFSE